MQNLIHLIRPDNFMDEVLSAGKHVLLLCMPRDDDFPAQLKLMEEIAVNHSSWLKVGLLAESFTGFFKQKFSIAGTPTFVIFFEGQEKNRMLGLADCRTLESFVLGTVRQKNNVT